MPYLTVTGQGRLGRDAELRFTKKGDPVASFAIATSEYRYAGQVAQESETVWVDCTLYGHRAEQLIGELTKGAKVYVTGDLLNSSYQTKDGQERTKQYIRVRSISVEPARAKETAPIAADPWETKPATEEETNAPF